MQFSEKKAEYTLELATKFADRRLSKMTLSSLGDFQSMRSHLTSIRGIGPWTAEYALMKSLRDPSAFPIDDVGLQNAVKVRLNRKTKPDKQEMHINVHPYSLPFSWFGVSPPYHAKIDQSRCRLPNLIIL